MKNNVTIVDSSLINSPTYTSEWRTLTAQSGANGSETTFTYDLKELPVKVDVQVKVTENGNDYIFTGFGSAQRDDDTDTYYGGVIYSYNEAFTRVLLPSFNEGYSGAVFTTKGSAAYTGGTGYTGSKRIGGRYNTVDVRVRVWLMCDFGDPAFQYEWVDLDQNTHYKEIQHKLGTYPDLVTVQTLCVGSSPSMYSDAQGTVYYGTGIDPFVSIGGVIFGYNANAIRLWSPSRSTMEDTGKNSAICNSYDGWGSNEHSYSGSGRVRILMWIFPSPFRVFMTAMTMAQGQNNTYEVDFLQQYNSGNYLIVVDVTVNNGNNDGFRFVAAGNSQTDGTKGQYGGIIYVYTNETLLLWRPSDLYNGKIVFIGGIWGGGIYQQSSTSGKVIIRIYNTSATDNGPCVPGICTRPVDSNNVKCSCPNTHSGLYCQILDNTTTTPLQNESALTNYTTSSTQFTSHTETTALTTTNAIPKDFTSSTISDIKAFSSALVTTYLGLPSISSSVSGSETSTATPTPATRQCDNPTAVANAKVLHNGTSSGCVALYSCIGGYFVASGDIEHYCLFGIWQGQLPVCSVCTLSHPSTLTPTSSEEPPSYSYKISRIHYKTTAMYKQTITCAYDPRSSAMYIGSGGILIICLFVLLPVIIDIVNVMQTRHKRRQTWRKGSKERKHSQ
ncbi:uncharacterized protein LOC110460658 [Mizuhopecten yessoensis]|uniref:uncharacterized protein LOC110460658 n=1 Tax=Mizuhopecten yessoensis TaxID=6573 RepID=UPI000B458B33|nr:uncharacterized protein LOC110460658 [Mizuhopecten yessoensis]